MKQHDHEDSLTEYFGAGGHDGPGSELQFEGAGWPGHPPADPEPEAGGHHDDPDMRGGSATGSAKARAADRGGASQAAVVLDWELNQATAHLLAQPPLSVQDGRTKLLFQGSLFKVAMQDHDSRHGGPSREPIRVTMETIARAWALCSGCELHRDEAEDASSTSCLDLWSYQLVRPSPSLVLVLRLLRQTTTKL